MRGGKSDNARKIASEGAMSKNKKTKRRKEHRRAVRKERAAHKQTVRALQDGIFYDADDVIPNVILAREGAFARDKDTGAMHVVFEGKWVDVTVVRAIHDFVEVTCE